MSADEGDQGGAGRREVAYRLFAAEYDDASFEYSEADEERAPNYVVTPTGARVNRLFAVGVLTEVESVSDDVLRGRVVDPTGAVVVYAGQYQPDAQTVLERAEPPLFVAVTGKARTYRPEDSDRVFTSVRPESINEVDAGTRDRWIVQAAAHTLDRIATMAAVLDRPERGDDLREVLLADGVDEGLAAGIPLAIDHYGTTTAYLDELRRTAVEAVETVAGERDEVTPPDIAPGEGGERSLDLAVTLDAGTGLQTAPAGTAGDDAEPASPEADAATAGDAEPATATAESPSGADDTVDAGSESAVSDAGEESDLETGAEAEPESGTPPEADASEPEPGEDDDLGDFDDYGDEGAEPVETDEMYEFDEGEREEIEEEFGTEFATGNEVGEPGEADVEAEGDVSPADAAAEAAADGEVEPESGAEIEVEPDTEAEAEAAAETPSEPGTEPAGDEADTAPEPEVEAGESDEGAAGADPADGPDEDIDLEAAVVDAMRDLDEGDGADREAVIERVVERGAAPDAVEDAIQDALMGGKCYEPEDGRLKAI